MEHTLLIFQFSQPLTFNSPVLREMMTKSDVTSKEMLLSFSSSKEMATHSNGLQWMALHKKPTK